MDTPAIIAALDLEIEHLQHAKKLLTLPAVNRGHAIRARRNGRMSPAGRARIAAAQKLRWAKVKEGRK